MDYFVKPGAGGLDFPQHLLFGPDGNLYVSATFTTGILRYDGLTGNFLGVAANLGNGQSGFAFGSDGLLYASNPFTNQILHYNGSTGQLIDVFVDVSEEGFMLPLEILFGMAGDVLISTSTPSQEGNVLRYDVSNGAFLGVFADNQAIHNPGFMTFGPVSPVVPIPSAIWLFLSGLFVLRISLKTTFLNC